MTIITIQVTSIPVQAALDELNRRCQHLQPALNSVGIEIQNHVIDCFENEKSPDGINWAALSPATIKKRQKYGNTNQKILRDTGSMFASLGHNASDSHVEITIGQDYAPWHQFGTSKMAARPFFPSQTLPQEWENDVMDVLNSYLTI